MESPKIELVQGDKVRVQYTDKDLDILNKKNKKVGIRDVIYNAVYDNKAIAAGLFREQVSNHKISLKKINTMIDEANDEIKTQQQNIAANKATIAKIEEILDKFEGMIEEVKSL